MSVRIAYRYAQSLYSKATEAGKTAEVASDMEQLLAVTDSNPDFRMFLASPIIDKKSKKEALRKIFKDCNINSLELFMLMVEKNREILLPDMAVEFTRIFNSNNGITQAEVISATKLDEDAIKQISEFVKSNTGAKTVNITVKEDQNLIGGVKILFEGKLYDNSISTQINNLKKELNIA